MTRLCGLAAALQLPTSGPALRALLLWGNYSHAFVMNPHKSCFFAWQLNKTAADTCIDLMGDLDDDMSTDERTRGQSCTESGCLWKVLTRFRDAEAPRLQLTQVQAWQSNAHKQGRLWMPKELVIDANDIVHRYPCMKEGCHNSSTGHRTPPLWPAALCCGVPALRGSWRRRVRAGGAFSSQPRACATHGAASKQHARHESRRNFAPLELEPRSGFRHFQKINGGGRIISPKNQKQHVPQTDSRATQKVKKCTTWCENP